MRPHKKTITLLLLLTGACSRTADPSTVCMEDGEMGRIETMTPGPAKTDQDGEHPTATIRLRMDDGSARTCPDVDDPMVVTAKVGDHVHIGDKEEARP